MNMYGAKVLHKFYFESIFDVINMLIAFNKCRTDVNFDFNITNYSLHYCPLKCSYRKINTTIETTNN